MEITLLLRIVIPDNWNLILYFSFEALPTPVRELLKIKKEQYNSDKMELTVEMTNAFPTKRFNRVFCNHCEAAFLPDMMKKYKTAFGGENVIDLVNCWDQAQVKYFCLKSNSFPIE